MAENKSLKKIPTNEISMLEYKSLNGDTYEITQNRTNQTFTIYKVVDGCYEKLGKGANPTALEEKYIKK